MTGARGRWSFAARLLVVTVALTTLLAAAVVLLVIGRAMPVRAARLHTRTVSRTLPPSASASTPARSGAGAPIVPRGLPNAGLGHRRRRWTPAQQLAHEQVRLAEAAASTELRREAHRARLRHRERAHRRLIRRRHLH